MSDLMASPQVETVQDPLVVRVTRALDEEVRPYLQSHGGDAELTGISDGVVRVRMFAACGACELKPVTFAARIRTTLLGVPGVSDVTCASVPLSSRRLDDIASFFA
jgi:Fe-S cluster biogenesis protein NfuA